MSMMRSEVDDVVIQTTCTDETADKWVCWVTGGKLDGYQETYAGEKSAYDGHQAVLARVMDAEGKPQTG